jgi:hypothetical protein
MRDASHDAESWATSDVIPAEARMRVYRNNSRAMFEQALQLTYPVVLGRVGHDYFRQLAHHFRKIHPSRCGDLHEVGRPFPGFLASYLAVTPYAWLAELATLEWSVAEASLAAVMATASVASLATVPADEVESARFRFVPSLQRVAGSVPVLSVWRANQPGAEPHVVDLSVGPEYVIVHRGSEGVEMRSVSRWEFEFIESLASGSPLGPAVEQSALPVDWLAGVLHWLFSDGVVAAVLPPAPA